MSNITRIKNTKLLTFDNATPSGGESTLNMTSSDIASRFVRWTLLKLIRETPQDDLNRCTQLNIIQFSAYFKYSIINNYNPLCNLKKNYVCG